MRTRTVIPLFLALLAGSGVGAPPPGPPNPGPGNRMYPNPQQVIDDPLTLPSWSPADQRELDEGKRPVNLGGGLFAPELFPLQPAPPLVKSSPPAIMPDPLPPGEGVDGVVPAPSITGRLGDAYFAKAPATPLIDPQRVLAEDKRRQLVDFFRTQTQEGSPPVHLFIFGGKQVLPDGVNPANLVDRWFPNRDAVFALYFMGEPERGQVIFSKKARDRFPIQETDPVEAACRAEAAGGTGAVTQLDQFTTRLALSLHGLSRTALPAAPVVAEVPAPAPPVRQATAPVAARSTELPPWLGWAAGALAAAAAFVALARRWRSSTGPVHFPEMDLVSRLGAPHSGGGGYVLDFGPAAED